MALPPQERQIHISQLHSQQNSLQLDLQCNPCQNYHSSVALLAMTRQEKAQGRLPHCYHHTPRAGPLHTPQHSLLCMSQPQGRALQKCLQGRAPQGCPQSKDWALQGVNIQVRQLCQCALLSGTALQQKVPTVQMPACITGPCQQQSCND